MIQHEASRLTRVIDVALRQVEQDAARQDHVEQRRLRFLYEVSNEVGPITWYHLTTHCELVSSFALELAGELEFTVEEAEIIRVAGVLHDIGKCGVPETVTAKPARLNIEEWRLMGAHADIGAEIAARLRAPDPIVTAVAHHHTKQSELDDLDLDDSLRRIVDALIVADAVVAMQTTRTYSDRIPLQTVLLELERGRGEQFASDVADAAAMILHPNHPDGPAGRILAA